MHIHVTAQDAANELVAEILAFMFQTSRVLQRCIRRTMPITKQEWTSISAQDKPGALGKHRWVIRKSARKYARGGGQAL